MTTHCGTTADGVEVFALPAYLQRHDHAAAMRHAAGAYARTASDFGRIVAVLLTSYGPRDFGPNGNYWTDRDRVAWFSYPGGMRHGGFYNVVPGVGPAPATDVYPRPTA